MPLIHSGTTQRCDRIRAVLARIASEGSDRPKSLPQITFTPRIVRKDSTASLPQLPPRGMVCAPKPSSALWARQSPFQRRSERSPSFKEWSILRCACQGITLQPSSRKCATHVHPERNARTMECTLQTFAPLVHTETLFPTPGQNTRWYRRHRSRVVLCARVVHRVRGRKIGKFEAKRSAQDAHRG